MKRLTILAVAAATLGGCATMSTAYHPSGLTGGYTDKKLADNRYYVMFGANGYSDPDMAFDFAVLRGAELCQQAGYAYFSVISDNRRLELSSTYVSGGGYSGFVAGSATKPVVEIEVQCSHEGGADARVTADTIRQIREGYPNHMPRTKG